MRKEESGKEYVRKRKRKRRRGENIIQKERICRA